MDRTFTSDTPRRQLGALLRVVGLVVGIVAAFLAFRGVDFALVENLLRDAGLLVLLMLLPKTLGSLAHAESFRRLLGAPRTTLLHLWRTVLTSEALRLVMPLGPAFSETYSATSARRQVSASWESTIAALSAKKALVIATHGLWLGGFVVLGGSMIGAFGERLGVGSALSIVLSGCAIALLLIGAFMLAPFVHDGLYARLLGIANRLSVAIRGREFSFATPRTLRARQTAVAGGMIALEWVTEFAESFIALWLVGIHITGFQAAFVELSGSLVRSLAFMVPGGLGVTDASYVGMLNAFTSSATLSAVAAFVALKRGKELVFVGIGSIAYMLDRHRISDVATLSTEKVTT
jgi:glycosyltransferase 2 family protein